MSEIVIKKLSDLKLAEVLPGLHEIYFESSARKDFANDDEKEKFFEKYLGFYLKASPELTWIALKDKKVLGYITGLADSHDPRVHALQPHLAIFEDLYQAYPAHLHINLHAETRGMGLGSKLLKEFETSLKNLHISGVHLITSASARNRSFYTRNGYTFEKESLYSGAALLFMGKAL